MKLDKIAFAQLVAHCVSNGMSAGEYEVATLDRLIDIEMPQQATIEVYPKNENVERLMKFMVEGANKIEAIKEHRAITGYALKESKDAVDRYWKPQPVKPNSYTYTELKAKLEASNMSIEEKSVVEAFMAFYL
jgi:ribosomal protein L7/L12